MGFKRIKFGINMSFKKIAGKVKGLVKVEQRICLVFP